MKKIEESDFPEIFAFEREWVEENEETHDREALEREEKCIKIQLAAYDALRLSGVVIRIDGEVKGFSYGAGLNGNSYDGIIQKADKEVPNIYKVLTMEVAKHIAEEYEYINISG